MPTLLELAVGGVLALFVLLYLMVALITPRRYWPTKDDGESPAR